MIDSARPAKTSFRGRIRPTASGFTFWAGSIAIVVGALIVRLAYITTLPNTLTFDEPIYDDIVVNILTGKGYTFSSSAYYTSIPHQPTSFQEPIYPLFLAVIYSLFGIGAHEQARTIQAILSTASVAIMLGVGLKTWGRAAAMGIGIIAAINVAFVYFSGLLMTETLYIFLLLAFVYLWTRGQVTHPSWLLLLAGVIFGAASLTRGLLFYYTPILLLITGGLELMRSASFRVSARRSFVLLAGIALIVTPWIIRNYLVHRTLVPVSTKGGFALYLYTYPVDNLDFNNRWDEVAIPDLGRLSEVQREAEFRRLALENISNHPALQLKFAFAKLVDFWNPVAERGPIPVRVAYAVLFLMVGLLAVFGFYRMGGRTVKHPLMILSVTLIGFHMLAAAVLTGGGKARLSVEPILVLTAGSGMHVFLRHFTQVTARLLPLQVGRRSFG